MGIAYTLTQSDWDKLKALGVYQVLTGPTFPPSSVLSVGNSISFASTPSSPFLGFYRPSGFAVWPSNPADAFYLENQYGEKIPMLRGNSNPQLAYIQNASWPYSRGDEVYNLVVPVVGWKMTQAEFNKLTAANLAMTVNGAPVSVGTVLPAGSSLSLSAGAGWNISSASINIDFGGDIVDFVISGDKKTATAKFSDVADASSTVVFTYVAVAPANLVWVTKPVAGESNTDVVFKWSGGSPSVNGYQVIVIDTATSSEVDNTHTVSPQYTMNRAAGNYTVKVYDKGFAVAPNSVITAYISVASVAPKYTVTIADIGVLTANNCHMDISGVAAVVGSTAFDGAVIQITAGERTQITNASIGSVSPWVFSLLNGGETAEYHVKEADIVVDGLSMRTVEIQPVPVAPFNNIYKVTPDIMREVNKQRFTYLSAGGEDVVIDYGVNILGVISLPFAIDPIFIKPDARIKLGSKELAVTAPVISTDVITVDLGSIVIPETYNNALDYVNTVAILRLPRIAPVAIDLEYVIGQTLEIKYDVDVYRGVATVNISSSKIGGVVITKLVDLGVNIPYIVDKVWTPAAENSGITIGGDNGVKTPFIEIVRNDSPLVNKMFSIPVVDEDVLGNHKGYIEVQNIDLSTAAIRSEKQDIISALQSGVIIR